MRRIREVVSSRTTANYLMAVERQPRSKINIHEEDQQTTRKPKPALERYHTLNRWLLDARSRYASTGRVIIFYYSRKIKRSEDRSQVTTAVLQTVCRDMGINTEHDRLKLGEIMGLQWISRLQHRSSLKSIVSVYPFLLITRTLNDGQTESKMVLRGLPHFQRCSAWWSSRVRWGTASEVPGFRATHTLRSLQRKCHFCW